MASRLTSSRPTAHTGSRSIREAALGSLVHPPTTLTRKRLARHSIRATRLLIEFREQDSYVNSDYDSDSSTASAAHANPNKQLAAYPFTPVNSITRQCYELAQAAQQQRLRKGEVPRITYRLTRMSASDAADARIPATFACVRDMGIALEFGESSQVIDPELPVARWQSERLLPSLQLNLDLSLLIALVSDITHAVLPRSDDEANERFKPVPRAWKKQANGNTEGVAGEGMEPGVEEHFRALAGQVKEEMRSSLIDDLEERLSLAVAHHAADDADVQLWTTAEARERCRDIVQKIGGPTEKRRCQTLFARDPDGFWRGSRHESRRGILRNLGVRVYEDEWAATSAGTSALPPDNSFRTALEETSNLLQQMGMDKVHSVEISALPYAVETYARPRQSRKGAPAEKIHIPTAHTSRSLLAGIQRGLTTVTANRMSVKQVVRALGRLEGLDSRSGEQAVVWVVEPKTLSEQKRCDLAEALNEIASGPSGLATAAVWVVEPRSLAEEMRI